MRGQRHALAALYPVKDPVPIVQEAGWALRPVWTGAENLAPTEIRSLDRPARSQSLYRLRNPAYHVMYMNVFLYQRNYSTCYILTQDEEWDVCTVRHRALSSNATEERCHFRIHRSVG